MGERWHSSSILIVRRTLTSVVSFMPQPLYFQWKSRRYPPYSGPGSVVGIETGYVLDGPGVKSLWDEIFRTCPERPWSPPSLLYSGYRVFPGGKEQPGREADPSPLLVPWSRQGTDIPLHPKGRTVCTEPQCLYKGALYLLPTILEVG